MNCAPIYERIRSSLDQRKKENLFRMLPPVKSAPGIIDLSTNSYLALDANTAVAEAAAALARGIWHGNLASPLVAQQSPLYYELEKEIASWKNTEAALVFTSGYAANIGMLQALAGRDTEVFCDRLNHASIIDGIRLSGAKFRRYAHADMGHLRSLLSASKSVEKIIVTDTVFSMEGDCAPLVDICELARSNGCLIMVDEAHATGIFGAAGQGLAEACGVADQIDVRMGTLSKSVAGLGGFFAGSALLRDYFVNHARSFIYSTGLPHAVLAHDLAAIRHIRKAPGLGAAVLDLAARLRARLAELGHDTMQSSSQIVPVKIGDGARAVECSAALYKKGILAPAIRPPTVPGGTTRLRLSVHSGLSEEQVEQVVLAFRNLMRS